MFKRFFYVGYAVVGIILPDALKGIHQNQLQAAEVREVTETSELSGLYIGMSAGVSFLTAEDIYPVINAVPTAIKAEEAVFQTDMAAGFNWRHFGVPVRSEISYGYRSALAYEPDPLFVGSTTRAETQTRTHSLFANVYYDIAWQKRLQPYIGAGVGISRSVSRMTLIDRVTGRQQAFREHSQNFAWNLMAGMTYALQPNLFLDGQYRYSDLGSVEYRTETTILMTADRLREHALSLGLRYMF